MIVVYIVFACVSDRNKEMEKAVQKRTNFDVCVDEVRTGYTYLRTLHKKIR